jgi:hypothetical protein
VVISVTIKAFPSKPVVAHSLLVVPKSILKLGPLQEAVTDIYASFPALSDAGFSGYGSWSISDPITKYGNSSAGYTHALAALDKPLSEAKAALEPLLKTLAKNTAVDVSVNWFEFPSYPAYYRAMSGVHQATGVPEFSLASRMFDKEALTSDRKALRKLIGKLAGNLLETTINQVLLVGGGKVLDEPDLSGANPAWRKTYLIHVVARGWLELFGPVIAKGIQDDITYNKYAAMRELTPSTGSYLNEVFPSFYLPLSYREWTNSHRPTETIRGGRKTFTAPPTTIDCSRSSINMILTVSFTVLPVWEARRGLSGIWPERIMVRCALQNDRDRSSRCTIQSWEYSLILSSNITHLIFIPLQIIPSLTISASHI